MNANDTQVGGDHYRKLAVQPWDALQAWLTSEQFDGYLLGNALSYLSRVNADQPGKGGVQDVRKAEHYIQKYLEMQARRKIASEEKMREVLRQAVPPRNY